MSNRMSKNPVIVFNNSVEKLERISLNDKVFKELWIQELLEKEPSILPTGDIDKIFEPLICIAREVETSSGFIDNLYISSKGYLVIVETKLWRNPEARREVVGQIIDYAKDVKTWNWDKINDIYKNYHNGSDLFKNLVSLGYYSLEDESDFIDIVEKNINTARFLLMIVGDGIREGVERMADFLNSNPNMQYRLALCELEVYKYGENRLVVPQLTLKTNVIERGIIRVDKVTNEVLDITMNNDDEKVVQSTNINKYSKDNYLTIDEWINTKLNVNVNKDDFRDLLDDFINNDFKIVNYTNDMRFDYYFNNLNAKIIFLRIFGDSESKVVLQPKTFYKFLDKYNYSRSLGDNLIENMRIYLSASQKNIPYEREEGYYYIDIETFLNNKDDILKIFNKFIDNI